MTVAPHDIDPARFLEDHLAQASPDLLREMLGTFINQLLSADADQVCGAAYGTISDHPPPTRPGDNTPRIIEDRGDQSCRARQAVTVQHAHRTATKKVTGGL